MLIDSNVHNEVGSIESLYPYLPPYFVEQFEITQFKGPPAFDQPYPPKSPITVRSDIRQSGQRITAGFVRDMIFSDEPDLTILLCTYAVESLHNPDQAVALARAVNDWQIAEWLSLDDRFRASIVVPSQIPQLAAEEIDRVGGHPGFVQVALPVRSHHPYGSRLYQKMWEAIDRNHLVAGLYFGGASGNPPTAVGWPSYFIEEYVDMSAVFAAQMTNLIAEGTFDRHEDQRVTLIESGVTWLPSHMWRMDKEWKELRMTVPWVRRPPSAYVRDHFRLTTAPIDLPMTSAAVTHFLEDLGTDEFLLYSSGFPRASHDGELQFESLLTETSRTRVQAQNARAWYSL